MTPEEMKEMFLKKIDEIFSELRIYSNTHIRFSTFQYCRGMLDTLEQAGIITATEYINLRVTLTDIYENY